MIQSVDDLMGTVLFPLSLRMNCYSSSDPAAENATIVYDFNVHQGDFWSRGVEDVQDQPLPHCSSTSLPRETQCAVCLDQVVYAVCRKLKDGVVLTMEALERHIKISKSGKKLSHSCPRHPGGFRVAAVHVALLYQQTLMVAALRVTVKKCQTHRRDFSCMPSCVCGRIFAVIVVMFKCLSVSFQIVPNFSPTVSVIHSSQTQKG